MKQLLIVLMILSILIVPASLAIQELDYVFKTGNNSQISRPCYNTGATGFCSATALCSISVFNPDNTVLLLGKPMTNQIFTHNYTLPILTEPGIYKVDIGCAEVTTNETGYDSFFIGVNDAGRDYNNSIGPYFILGIIVLLMIIFALASYFMGNVLKLSFLALSVLMLPVSLWVGLDIARNSFMSNAIINVMSTGFVMSLICFFAIAMYVLITLTMQLKIQKTFGIPNTKASPAYWQKKQKYKADHKGDEFR